MSIKITGTTALVTGANRGIGRALVEALLARGAAKVYAAARKPESLNDLVASSNGRVVPIRLDITRPSEIRAAAALADDVKLVVNNAGVVSKFGGDVTDAGWLSASRDEFEVNVLGALAVTQAFVPRLEGRSNTAIVNVGSVAGLVNFPVIVSYSASKAALHSLTQGLRASLRPRGIHVAGVYPGPIETDMSRDIDLPKASASSTAYAILDGLEAGQEDIFPDPFSLQFSEQYARSPKGVEQQYTAPPPVVEEVASGAVA
jgi:NAD(P)-dependent dehydrogenase (short-subunit alcohol dehydrogenase family)